MSDELTREQIEQIDALYRLATRANQSRAPVMALEQTYDESDLRDTLRHYWPQIKRDREELEALFKKATGYTVEEYKQMAEEVRK